MRRRVRRRAPRVCGDDPVPTIGGPHVELVLPAYAGMIPNGGESIAEKVGAPRVCGDDPVQLRTAYVERGCSPRMRG